MPEKPPFTVGLEIHVRLNTRHKIFCACPNRSDGPPNSHTCPVCLGLPGALPVLNPEVPGPALRLALALGCTVATRSEFTRKNYFYPDLPRNYQITQQRRPLATAGRLEGVGLEGVGLERLHLEEDAGRSRHGADGQDRVDLNRAGAPLAEIVTLPGLRDGTEARQALARMRQLVRHLGVGDGDMEKGSLRCDANVGLGPGHPLAGPWIEIKNLNSLRFVQRAVDQEIQRLASLLAAEGKLRRQTRGWDPGAGRTFPLRLKEELADYLYLPEPDLPPLILSEARIEAARRNLPELPWVREDRYRVRWGVPRDDARTLCRAPELAGYFEATVVELGKQAIAPPVGAPEAARWILSRLLAAAGGKDEALDTVGLSPQGLATLLSALLTGRRTKHQIREVWERALAGQDPADLLAGSSPSGLSRAEIGTLARAILQQEPALVARYRDGHASLLNHFVGKLMGAAGGGAEPAAVREILLDLLEDCSS
ncbi:MAG: Asp-tRNA(Asn)/Glu-tRNA(Gln) amidotransferase GatCAB subunit B [Deltaproteobacteria bacterium]|nr:MAG: Asp-tRNA(Asn)/Glu-tRNA(Gln) amidotransferase GatCAB subunit B [Deltaproteobacteria bacterium]